MHCAKKSLRSRFSTKNLSNLEGKARETSARFGGILLHWTRESFHKFHTTLNLKSELFSGRIQRASVSDIVNPWEEEEKAA